MRTKEEQQKRDELARLIRSSRRLKSEPLPPAGTVRRRIVLPPIFAPGESATILEFKRDDHDQR